MSREESSTVRPSNYRVDFGSADVQLQRRADAQSADSQTSLGELDEETIRWGVLITRIICIVLLLLIIFAAWYGSEDGKNKRLYYILSILFSCVLIVVFMLSFCDLEMLRSRTIWTGRFSIFSHHNSEGSFASWPRTSSASLQSPLNEAESFSQPTDP